MWTFSIPCNNWQQPRPFHYIKQRKRHFIAQKKNIIQYFLLAETPMSQSWYFATAMGACSRQIAWYRFYPRRILSSWQSFCSYILSFLFSPRVGVFSLHKTGRIKKTGQEFQKNFYIFSKKEKWHFRNSSRHFKSAIFGSSILLVRNLGFRILCYAFEYTVYLILSNIRIAN